MSNRRVYTLGIRFQWKCILCNQDDSVEKQKGKEDKKSIT
jgi:hypothetical protein